MSFSRSSRPEGLGAPPLSPHTGARGRLAPAPWGRGRPRAGRRRRRHGGAGGGGVSPGGREKGGRRKCGRRDSGQCVSEGHPAGWAGRSRLRGASGKLFPRSESRRPLTKAGKGNRGALRAVGAQRFQAAVPLVCPASCLLEGSAGPCGFPVAFLSGAAAAQAFLAPAGSQRSPATSAC